MGAMDKMGKPWRRSVKDAVQPVLPAKLFENPTIMNELATKIRPAPNLMVRTAAVSWR
jgi:hypothetical protein